MKLYISHDDHILDDLRCPFCREMQMMWVSEHKGQILYSFNGLAHDCKDDKYKKYLSNHKSNEIMEPSLYDQRECLIRDIREIERQIVSLPKNHHWRKNLGIKKRDMQDQLSMIKKRMKIANLRSKA